MPLLHLSARLSAAQAHDVVQRECAIRGRTYGVNGFQRTTEPTESERLRLTPPPVYAALRPVVLRVHHRGAE